MVFEARTHFAKRRIAYLSSSISSQRLNALDVPPLKRPATPFNQAFCSATPFHCRQAFPTPPSLPILRTSVLIRCISLQTWVHWLRAIVMPLLRYRRTTASITRICRACSSKSSR